MFVVCGRTLWHIVQVAPVTISTDVVERLRGVAPPPPTSVTGPGAVVLRVRCAPPIRAADSLSRLLLREPRGSVVVHATLIVSPARDDSNAPATTLPSS